MANWSKYRYEEDKKPEKKSEAPKKTPEEIADSKAIDFDKTHIPGYGKAWKAVRNPVRDDRTMRGWNEKIAVFSISTMPEMNDENSRNKPHFRVVLLKGENDRVEDIMSKTTANFAEDRADNKDPRNENKQIPSLAIVGIDNEIVGAPVPVDKYLLATRNKSLLEESKKREDKSPVFEAAYNEREKGNMEYEATWMKNEKAFHKEEKKDLEKENREIKSREENKQTKDKNKKKKPRVIDGKLIQDRLEEADLRAKLIRVNEYVRGQDMAEEARQGSMPVKDADPITQTDNIEVRARTQISKAKGNEIIRQQDPMTTQDKRIDANRDGVPDVYEYDGNNNGIPDRYETFEDVNNNGIPDDLEFRDEDHNGIDDRSEPANRNARDDYDKDFDDPNYEPVLGGTYGSLWA